MRLALLLPLLAALGFAAAAASIVKSDETSSAAAQQPLSLLLPFKHYVAGTGLIEASTGNIAIGTPVSGIVGEIYVTWGEDVSASAPLFKLDDRDLAAQLIVAEAGASQAVANLAKSQNLLDVAQGLKSGLTITAVDLANRRFDVQAAQAALASAKAEIERIKVDIERRIVRAPTAGRVLQINIHKGEFATSGAVTPPLMLFGDVNRLDIRVDIDEFDAWRVGPTATALAYVPGNLELKTPLRFERIERYVVPKTNLTGASTERTDTRVLQVIYSFARNDLPVYVGQRMDVFVAAPPAAGKTGEGGAAKVGEGER
jgi:HlyD family secretion protein